MSSHSKTPPSVIAVGVVAILGSCFVLLSTGLAAFGLTFLPRNGPSIAGPIRVVIVGSLIVFATLAVFGIVTGAGLFRLKNWARISALIWAGVTVVFSALALVFGSMAPFPNTPGAPEGMIASIRAFVLVFYGVPIGIGIWWLILLNRRRIAALFGGQAETGDPSMQTGGAVQVGRRRPLVITVVAVFLLFSSLSIFMLALLPMPMVLFGRVIHGFGGTVLFAVYSAACLASGIGLLKLKPWAYWLAIGYHAVLVLSAIVSLLSPNYESATQEALASFHG